MQADIHPKTRWVIFQDTISGCQFRVMSAIKTEATVKIEGQDYPLVKVDVSSASHPFYTGQQRILDTAGRVEKFGNKFGGKSAVASLLKKKTK
jgi:large subunit ribosomal protein L31